MFHKDFDRVMKKHDIRQIQDKLDILQKKVSMSKSVHHVKHTFNAILQEICCLAIRMLFTLSL